LTFEIDVETTMLHSIPNGDSACKVSKIRMNYQEAEEECLRRTLRILVLVLELLGALVRGDVRGLVGGNVGGLVGDNVGGDVGGLVGGDVRGLVGGLLRELVGGLAGGDVARLVLVHSQVNTGFFRIRTVVIINNGTGGVRKGRRCEKYIARIQG
jgi:hypothetical protein